MNNISVSFKVDTRAEVAAISKDTQILGLPKVEEPIKKLHGPNRQSLDLIASLTVTMIRKQHKCTQDTFVVKQLKHNLLGL